MRCILQEAQASADSPCIRWYPKSRDWKTKHSESFLLLALPKKSQTGKRFKSLVCFSPGANDGVSGQCVKLRSHWMAENTCLTRCYKNLSNVLSLNILPPGYLISNLFSNWGFGNSNRLLSLKKNEIFVGDRWGFSKFNLCVVHPRFLHWRLPLLALITPISSWSSEAN